MIHFGSQSGNLYSINLNDNSIYKNKISDQDITLASIGDNKIFAISKDGYIYGLSSAVLVAESAMVSAEKSITHAMEFGADVTQGSLLLQNAKQKYTEEKYNESISQAREAEQIIKESEINHVIITIADAEKSLNNIKHLGLEMDSLEKLLQESRDLLSQNEIEKAIKIAKDIEIFSTKFLSINIEINEINDLHGNSSKYDDKLETVYKLIKMGDLDNAFEQIEILDTHLIKDINGWKKTYQILILINTFPLVLLIFLKFRN